MNNYPSIVNNNGVYSSLYNLEYNFMDEEKELIQNTKESERGYLDETDLNFFYYKKRINNTSKCLINIIQDGRMIQCNLQWSVHFNLVDNLIINFFHLIEPVRESSMIVNEVSLTKFFKMNRISIESISIIKLPSKTDDNYYSTINTKTSQTGAFIYHFIPDIGVCTEQRQNPPGVIKRLHVEFEDFVNMLPILKYFKFQGEELFYPREPEIRQFERKRF